MSQSATRWVACSTCGTSWPVGTSECPADGTALGADAAKRPLLDLGDDDDSLEAGTTVGEYRIENLLGRGGMGEVYGARHPVIGKRVAIKVMNRLCSSNPINVERFVQEAKAVNAIGHSNIVDIFSFGRTPDGRCYFVMEWLQGESLRTRVERGPLETAKAYDILDNVLRPLEAAHDAGIVHRDLKPDNIFLVASKGDSEPERVKLLDFGIAKLSGDRVGPKTSMTQTGTVIGTPTHMSPEQATGGAIGAATDVYSLGVVAFELATGKLPFNAESSVQLMAKHVDDEPPKPSSVWPTPPGFERLILDMLQKRPAARPTAKEIRARIAKLRTEPTATEATGERQVVHETRATAPTLAAKLKSEPLIPVVVSAPSLPIEPIEPNAPIQIEKPVIAMRTPRAVSVPAPATGVVLAERRRPIGLVVSAGALVMIAIAVFVAMRGGHHANPKPASVPPAAAAEQKSPSPPQPAATPAPVATGPASVPASTPVDVTTRTPPGPKPVATVKKPVHATPHHADVPHEAGSASAAPTVVAAPAQGSASATPAPHDVDAVRDPFATGGSK